MNAVVEFKRMILGLPHSPGDYLSVAFTAELAGQLGLDIVGLFIEDGALENAAGLSCVREFHSLSGGWRPVDRLLWIAHAGEAVSRARRLFRQAAETFNVQASFDLSPRHFGDVFEGRSGAGDLIVVIEPKNPVERVSHQYRRLMHDAFGARAPVLLIPSRIARRTGPVVAVATGADDPGLIIGLRIAQASHERLLVLAPRHLEDASLAALARSGRVPVERGPFVSDDASIAEVAQLLSRLKERFVILDRRMAGTDFQPLFAFGRGVPVLVTERPSGRDSEKVP